MTDHERTHEEATHARPLDRRGFLKVSTLGTGALAFGGASLLTACDPEQLLPANADGILVHPFFTARIVATTGQPVASTGYTWHIWPDGGGVFPLPDGGWSYVSNSEWILRTPGGAGASFIRFDANANIIDAGRVLEGTLLNCAGGKTPWGTWLSCEEYDLGLVWECDPIGSSPAVSHPAMGTFRHEAAACHEGQQIVYLTEDIGDGGFYRFIPTTWGDLSAGTLEVMTEVGAVIGWATVPDPTAAVTPTRQQVADMKVFNGGEGIDISGNNLVFATKGDDRVWSYDPTANTLTVLYDASIHVNGILNGVDNVETSDNGVIYVAEDGGNMQIVLVREDGSTFPVVQIEGNDTSELCGPAFDPSGTRMYFSDQRNPGRTIEVEGPWWAFTEPGRYPGLDHDEL